MGKTAQRKIKVLENTHTKDWRFRIEAVTNIGGLFYYMSEDPKNIEISTPIL